MTYTEVDQSVGYGVVVGQRLTIFALSYLLLNPDHPFRRRVFLRRIDAGAHHTASQILQVLAYVFGRVYGAHRL